MSKIVTDTKNLIKKIIKVYKSNKLNKLKKEYKNIIKEMSILRLEAYAINSEIEDITGGNFNEKRF